MTPVAGRHPAQFNWEKKTCNEARTGQVWAVKKLRELISFEAAQFGSVWANKVPAENVRVWPFDARRGGIRVSAHFRADFEGVGPRRAEKDVRREERSNTNWQR